MPKEINAHVKRVKTGVRNLDTVLCGGFPKRALVVFTGAPGSGKTILSHQIGFYNASLNFKVIFFQTLSEPTMKTLTHSKRFSFFDSAKIGKLVHFVDLGDISSEHGLEKVNELITDNIKRIKPSLVVIDSFKTFEDLSSSPEVLRKFTYQIAVNVAAWECTCFLLGEYSYGNIKSNPIFSVIDGIVTLSQDEESGEQQRFIQISKMRSTDHSRDRHSITISNHGIDVYSPKLTIQREEPIDEKAEFSKRCRTGIQALDSLIEDGISFGSSVLISGTSGTGKTLLALEFVYRGAKEFNEKGIIFLFQETQESIRVVASSRGWNLDTEIKRGMLEIVTVSQTDILIQKHLLMIHEQVTDFQPKRMVVDSTSVFLHKIVYAENAREKIYQLATIVQNVKAVGFFITDVPYGETKISRFGVEETAVDGIILLTSPEEGLRRERYLEVYKLRNTRHAKGKRKMRIGTRGIEISQD